MALTPHRLSKHNLFQSLKSFSRPKLNPFLNGLYRGFNLSWSYLIQIILILRSIGAFANKIYPGYPIRGLLEMDDWVV